jgi:putative transcriptional regulator
MSKLGKSLLEGADQALDYALNNRKNSKVHRVKIPADIDVLSIRRSLHMTRARFANAFGFSLRTLEKWEQGIRHPTGAARAYLFVIQNNPEVVTRTLSDFQ